MLLLQQLTKKQRFWYMHRRIEWSFPVENWKSRINDSALRNRPRQHERDRTYCLGSVLPGFGRSKQWALPFGQQLLLPSQSVPTENAQLEGHQTIAGLLYPMSLTPMPANLH
jgi:hypothetical protein